MRGCDCGVVYAWTHYEVKCFLESIAPSVASMSPSEIYTLMHGNGILRSNEHSQTNRHIIKQIKNLCHSASPETELERIAEMLEVKQDAPEKPTALPTSDEIEPEPDAEKLPVLHGFQALKTVDNLVASNLVKDEEVIEFLIANRVSQCWDATLNDPLFSVEDLRKELGGMYFQKIKERFLEQYEGAQNLPIPKGYSFTKNGVLAPPNLMQRLTAYRVLTEKRLGNWSGVGAGKTVSAVLSSRVIDAKFTVIVAINATVEAWAEVIQNVFPDSVVITKERGEIAVNRRKHTYLVLNYESFQQGDSHEMVERLLAQHKIDFLVLDEVQKAKQRDAKTSSLRRGVLEQLVFGAAKKNWNLHVLGMSATPVINGLHEAKSLLELVKGETYPEIKTVGNVDNALAIHRKLMLSGIRYRPRYDIAIHTQKIEIDGEDLIPELLKANKNSPLELESILLQGKMETVISCLKPGTLIYSHYKTGMVSALKEAAMRSGFTVGLYTGDDKTGLESFVSGAVDILIATSPINTGVDGLQYRTNRLVVASLPWTSAEMEQLIGRLFRQGSVFDKIEVFVPQVVLKHDGKSWSWDAMRYSRLEYKKTLADCAVDGVIPEGVLSSPKVLQQKAQKALEEWVKRLDG